MKLLHRTALASALAFTTSFVAAAPVELLTNGNFESGLASWTVANQANGSGNWFSDTVGTTTPASGLATSGTGGASGLYAVTDQTGPGAHALSQAFTVDAGAASVLVSFKMFANDWSNLGPLNAGALDFNLARNQHARVDIMKVGATAFSVAAADIAMTLLAPMVDLASDPNPFQSYSFDITTAVASGGTFVLRFAEVDNQSFFNVGVDNASVTATAAEVPEPATLLLAGAALLGLAASRRRV